MPFNSVTELSLSPSAYILELTVHSALAFSAALAVMLNKPSGNESPDMIKANAINIAELLRNHSLLRLDFIVHTLTFLTIQCFVTFTQNQLPIFYKITTFDENVLLIFIVLGYQLLKFLGFDVFFVIHCIKSV